MSRAGSVLDAAVEAGANAANGISFGVQNSSAAKSRAMQTAIADAQQHASTMARSLKVSLATMSRAEEVSFGKVQCTQGCGGGGGGV